MQLKTRCPNPGCKQSYTVTESQLGQTVVCEKCGKQFTLSGSAVGPGSPAAETGGPPAHETKPASSVPKQLGRFEIRERIGAGAFGQVFRAYDPTLDRDVALKVPHRGTLQREKDKTRFFREPKAAAQLRHPNIVPVYDAGVDGDIYYIASAFIEGQTLSDAIDEKPFDLRRSAEIVMDLARALDYAHRKGIVHRDVKPANIMLDTNGDPLVMDFGLARFEEGQDKLTHDGTVLGTPAYMAPEQARGELDQVRPASDQYSLGVVLYELLCGKVPFEGPPTLVISLVINHEPTSPRSERPEVPKDLETICLKAMAKDPRHRYPTCRDLAEDLRRWHEGQPIQSRRLPFRERLWRWAHRNPALAFLSATSALLLSESGEGHSGGAATSRGASRWSAACGNQTGAVSHRGPQNGLVGSGSARRRNHEGERANRTGTPAPQSGLVAA
ncbi:MAG: protein kinase [Planctomycetota bacterium]|nr:protein kinase [Planctomycetota bacterium]